MVSMPQVPARCSKTPVSRSEATKRAAISTSRGIAAERARVDQLVLGNLLRVNRARAAISVAGG
jgi:hypothetical protein